MVVRDGRASMTYYPGWSEPAEVGRRRVRRAHLLHFGPVARAVACGRLEPQRAAGAQHHALRLRRRPNLTQGARHPGLEFRIAIVGPLTSLALGVLFAVLLGGALSVQRRPRRHLREPGDHQRLARRLQHAARLPARRRPRTAFDRLVAQPRPSACDAHCLDRADSGSRTG